jgi:hypothetical protein
MQQTAFSESGGAPGIGGRIAGEVPTRFATHCKSWPIAGSTSAVATEANANAVQPRAPLIPSMAMAFRDYNKTGRTVECSVNRV